MTTDHRTSTGRSPNAGRTALVALTVVALTAAALALAGTAPKGIGAPTQSAKRVQLDQRTFTCAGGIPGAGARRGSVAAGLSAVAPVGDEPTQFDAA
jgi:hypothetical protein